MRDFIISTDSTADLPTKYLEENNIVVHPLYYIVDGKEYTGTTVITYEKVKTSYDVTIVMG